MSDQSRVEAVADGIEEILPGNLLLSFERSFAIDMAKAAIEANDAWLSQCPNLVKHMYMATIGATNEDTLPSELDEFLKTTPEDTDR